MARTGEMPTMETAFPGYGQRRREGVSEVLQEALMMLVAPGASIVKKLPFAAHGTDIDRLKGILKEGLKPGSALDFSKGKMWVKDYPVRVWLKNPEKGKYIAHNDYFTLGKAAKPHRVTIDLDHYTDVGAEDALEEVGKLKKQFPKISFKIKGSMPSGEGLTKANITKLFTKRYGSSADEIVDMARETAEDISTDSIRRMYGYKKPMRTLNDVELYLDWLEEGAK